MGRYVRVRYLGQRSEGARFVFDFHLSMRIHIVEDFESKGFVFGCGEGMMISVNMDLVHMSKTSFSEKMFGVVLVEDYRHYSARW